MEENYSFKFPSALLYIIPALAAPLLLFILRRKRGSRNRRDLPPGSYGWPVVGETLSFLRASRDGAPERFVRERKERYGSEVFKTSMLGEPMVVFCGGPNGYKFLFSNENKLVKVWWPSTVRTLLGKCLATTSGGEGMQMKKMISWYLGPDAFTKLYIKTMDTVAQQHVQTHWQAGEEEVKVFPAVRLYTFELACRLFMSVQEPDHIAKLASLFDVFLKGVISIPFNFPGTRFFKANRATREIKAELRTIVRNRKADLEQKTATSSQDLLSHLLVNPDENGKFMPESVIVNNMLLLLFAGHDTSSSAIMLLIRYLALLPDVFERVLREQNGIASSKKAGEFLQWEDIQKMKYSWNVVSEVLRLSSPIVGSYREAMTDLSYGGYHIPKGWKLYWSAPFAHTDSSLFPNNREFDPSRFEGAGPVPYSYVPFGGGARMCVGKEFSRVEILIFLHNLIKRGRWDLVIPDEKIVYDPIPTPVHGLPIRLRPHGKAT